MWWRGWGRGLAGSEEAVDRLDLKSGFGYVSENLEEGYLR